ncbi:MAG: DUF433 domain-containing protein [Bacteroidota bacterium]
MAFLDRIAQDPSVRSGTPCIRDTRITVVDLLEYLEGGMTEAELLDDFSDLEADDIRAALVFASKSEGRLSQTP